MSHDVTSGPVRLHWGAAIALVYGAFAAATLGFVAFALRQPVDLVSPDYYARSLQQDEQLAATRRADALTPAIVCELDADGRSLIVRVPPAAAGEAVGTLTLYRPSNGRADRSLPLAAPVDGVWRAPLDDLERGRWKVQLEWRARGLHYRHERSLDLR